MDIDWATRIITVFKTDPFFSFIGGSVYEMDTAAFKAAVQNRLDDEDGQVFPSAFNHNSATLLGGIEYARILEFINSYTITFDDTGGGWVANLVGSNNNILDVTNLTTVQVRSNNSAGLINVREIQQDIFGGVITIDSTLGTAGTQYPAGTPLQPVSNVTDAATIAGVRGITKYRFIGDYIFQSGDNIDGISCVGEGPSLTGLDLGSNTSTIRAQFFNCELTGDVNGAIRVRDCHCEDLTGVGSMLYETEFENCLLEPGTVFQLENAIGIKNINIINCHSGSPGDTPVIMDFIGSDAGTNIRKYDGGMRITNVTQGNDISIGGDAHIVADSTCTDGNIVTRGDIKITDNSTGTFTVTDQSTYNKVVDVWQRSGLDPNNPLVTDEDGSFSTGSISVGANTTGTTPNRQTTQTRT